jgi:hypothetical protein
MYSSEKSTALPAAGGRVPPKTPATATATAAPSPGDRERKYIIDSKPNRPVKPASIIAMLKMINDEIRTHPQHAGTLRIVQQELIEMLEDYE